MSLRSLPLIVLAFILYNVVVLLFGGVDVLDKNLFEIPMLSGVIRNSTRQAMNTIMDRPWSTSEEALV